MVNTGFVFVMIVNAEESPDKGENFTEGGEHRGVDNALWWQDETCNQKSNTYDNQGDGAHELDCQLFV
jgi:hypothetical protein